jgi:hypothetical protein
MIPMCNPLDEANKQLALARAEYFEAIKPGNLEATLVCVAIDRVFNIRREVCKVRYELAAKKMERKP